jgi:hypothetical protein
VRVALLCRHRAGRAAAEQLGGALRDAGHEARMLRGGVEPLADVADGLLRRRGFTDALSAVPLGLAALRAGGFDLAHAFSPADAVAAQLWGDGPVVFTCAETLGRHNVADRRLRLALLRRAVERSDAVLAPDDDGRAALARWLAVDAPVLEPGDAAGHLQLYRDLLAQGV